MALARPSTSQYATDRNVGATRRAVLDVTAKAPGFGIRRREIELRVFGTNKAGGSSIASAIGWLRNAGFVTSRSGHFRATPAGRWALDLHTDEAAFDGSTPPPILNDDMNPYARPAPKVIAGVGPVVTERTS